MSQAASSWQSLKSWFLIKDNQRLLVWVTLCVGAFTGWLRLNSHSECCPTCHTFWYEALFWPQILAVFLTALGYSLLRSSWCPQRRRDWFLAAAIAWIMALLSSAVMLQWLPHMASVGECSRYIAPKPYPPITAFLLKWLITAFEIALFVVLLHRVCRRWLPVKQVQSND